MRISDWSSDVCSSDLDQCGETDDHRAAKFQFLFVVDQFRDDPGRTYRLGCFGGDGGLSRWRSRQLDGAGQDDEGHRWGDGFGVRCSSCGRSEEHTSELQSLMRISYAVFCLKKKKKQREKQTLYEE